ncbi:MAG: ABC transporter permease [Caldilineaceae bacterium]|nr:ABC transporter permease [Caldilineaceae bacterium]MCB9157374.1 ABC transporter permease [Caldilineaceae bacterium]
MKLFRYFSVALTGILAHKLRAGLTMLGIIIGVAAVLTTTGFGSGAAADITANIQNGGVNLLTISSGSSRGGNNPATMTMADAQALSDAQIFPDLVYVAPQYSSSATYTSGSEEGTYQTIGATANYAIVTDLDIEYGQFFTAEQVEKNESVVVLGHTVATDLFGTADAVGQSVRINNNAFQVIGVLEESGGAGFGSNDTRAYVPLQVAQGRLFNASRYRGNYSVSTISIQVATAEGMDDAAKRIEQTLRMRHNLSKDDTNDFTISNQADLLETISNVTGTLSILLGSIGGISLLVGGIGIMNIMLVTVTERTREIGLRKAVGAHNSDILLQFLIESLVLCVLGGLIGIGFSYGVAAILSRMSFMPFAIVIEYWALVLAIGVSSASGFIFGLYPAWRATKLDPIEALRFE